MNKFQLAPSPITQLTNYDNLYLLREDLNLHGSFKDRALSYQIQYLKNNNINTCVISSSGNAAIAAAAHCAENNIKCIILVSPSTDKAKLSQIIKHKPHLVIQSKQARRLANYIHKKHGIYLLNPSKDDKAIEGFESLGQDIHENNPGCQAIFSYVTSGASLLGMISYYKKQSDITFPHFIGVQSGEQQFLACDVFGQIVEQSEQQIAGKNAINRTPRSNQIFKELNSPFPKNAKNQPIINNHVGKIYWVPEQSILKNLDLLRQNGINSSPEGAAALTAAIDFSRQYPQLKNAVVIISGTEHETLSIPDDFDIYKANSKEDIEQILLSINKK